MIEKLPHIIILIFSVVFHEVAHGWIALKRGDTTAKDAGRLTLNPIPHIDPFRTILLPLVLLLMHSPVLIGSAKPVPVNPWRFKDPKKDMALVGAAGPGSNIMLAIGAAICFRLFWILLGAGSPFTKLMVYAVLINLVLAFFNLMPVPPLDGSRIVLLFLSDEQANRYSRIEPYGFFIVLGLLFLGFFQWIIWPIVVRFLYLLVGPEGLYILMGR
jgi:Zn-dependent protease